MCSAMGRTGVTQVISSGSPSILSISRHMDTAYTHQGRLHLLQYLLSVWYAIDWYVLMCPDSS